MPTENFHSPGLPGETHSVYIEHLVSKFWLGKSSVTAYPPSEEHNCKYHDKFFCVRRDESHFSKVVKASASVSWPSAVVCYQKFKGVERFGPPILNALSHAASHPLFVEFNASTVHHEIIDDAVEVYTIIHNAVPYVEFMGSSLPSVAEKIQINENLKDVSRELQDNNVHGYDSPDNIFIVIEEGKYTIKVGGYWVPRISNIDDEVVNYDDDDVDVVSGDDKTTDAGDFNIRDQTPDEQCELQSESQSEGRQNPADDFSSQSTVPPSHIRLIKDRFNAFSDTDFSLWQTHRISRNRYDLVGQRLNRSNDAEQLCSTLFSIETQCICDVNRRSIDKEGDLSDCATRVEYYCGPILVIVTMIKGCIGTLGRVVKGPIKSYYTICGLKAPAFILSITVQLVSSVAYLNEKGITHGNIERNNIFIIPEPNGIKALIGYTANHDLLSIDIDPKKDVLAIGTTLYSLILGEEPKVNQSLQNLEMGVENSRFRELAKPFGLHFIRFVEATLQSDVAKRPTATEALLSPLLLFHATSVACVQYVMRADLANYFHLWLKAVILWRCYNVIDWAEHQNIVVKDGLAAHMGRRYPSVSNFISAWEPLIIHYIESLKVNMFNSTTLWEGNMRQQWDTIYRTYKHCETEKLRCTGHNDDSRRNIIDNRQLSIGFVELPDSYVPTRGVEKTD